MNEKITLGTIGHEVSIAGNKVWDIGLSIGVVGLVANSSDTMELGNSLRHKGVSIAITGLAMQATDCIARKVARTIGDHNRKKKLDKEMAE